MAVTYDHLTMVAGWLRTPEVVRWWGDPAEQHDLVRGDLDHPDMDQFIVASCGRPFGYIQCYRLSAWNSGFGEQPPQTRGIDQFIGEPEMIGCGHGAAFIRQFVDALLEDGTPRVVTDPDPANQRAIRAYEKAGLARDRVVDTPDGPALLMRRETMCELAPRAFQS
ncbi:GNAT family N-acetyltransferase [Bradyrhizobium sp.]|uniref:GNAT family N-acetyltransferase n=1 Tax=Bradyrhizobium sp. TaxID=376 RepID=UPI001ECAD8C8|nr:GNAT family N-acetyltransferase [Bradyrhizobium sp.]MBV9984038.1 acetyltransferase [Bradyrhizobium sp.]